MKLRRQQQIERELNGYRAWIDKAGMAGWGQGRVVAGGRLHGRQRSPCCSPPNTSVQRSSLDQSRQKLYMPHSLWGSLQVPLSCVWHLTAPVLPLNTFLRQAF